MEVQFNIFAFEKSADFELFHEQFPDDVIQTILQELLQHKIRTAVSTVQRLAGLDDTEQPIEYTTITPYQPISKFNALPDTTQNGLLLEPTPTSIAGPPLSTSQRMYFSFSEGDIEFIIESEDLIIGSLFQRLRASITVSDFKDVGKNVISALLAGAILATVISPVPAGSANELSENIYVCSINGHLDGNRLAIESDAISDLKIYNNSDAHEQLHATRARQLCLKAAGFDPGPIDGIHGKRTTHAQNEFAQTHGGIIVNWNSEVFLRFLIQKAMEYQGR